jgi:hypothetical protein
LFLGKELTIISVRLDLVCCVFRGVSFTLIIVGASI